MKTTPHQITQACAGLVCKLCAEGHPVMADGTHVFDTNIPRSVPPDDPRGTDKWPPPRYSVQCAAAAIWRTVFDADVDLSS